MRSRERLAWEAKKERIVRVAKDEPDMPLCLLAERFGMTREAVHAVLLDAGIRREPDFFSDYINSRRRSA